MSLAFPLALPLCKRDDLTDWDFYDGHVAHCSSVLLDDNDDGDDECIAGFHCLSLYSCVVLTLTLLRCVSFHAFAGRADAKTLADAMRYVQTVRQPPMRR